MLSLYILMTILAASGTVRFIEAYKRPRSRKRTWAMVWCAIQTGTALLTLLLAALLQMGIIRD